MPTALLAWELGGGAGHCVNLRPIAAGLLERGWRVWLAARDLAAAKREFGPLPVEYLQAPFFTGPMPNKIDGPRNFAHILHNIGFGSEETLAVLCEAWRNLLEMVRPNVVVCEHSPTALLAARWTDSRRVTIGTGFFSPPDVEPLPDLCYWMAPDTERLARDEAEVLDRVNRLLVADNLEPLSHLGRLYAEVDANFILTFAELDHYPNRAQSASGSGGDIGQPYWGMWWPSGGVPAEWPNGGGPKVIAYLKPFGAKRQLGAGLNSLREFGISTIAYVPGARPEWLAQFQSPRLRFAKRPIDVADAARKSDAAILNGNAGTSTQLLLAGVPQLNMPLYLEQLVFSKRVEETGAGLIALPHDPQQFAIHLKALLSNGKYRTAAQSFAQRHSNHNAASQAETICETIAMLMT